MNQIVVIAAAVVGFAIAAPKLMNVYQGDNAENINSVSVKSTGPQTAVGYRNAGGQFDFNSSMNGLHVQVLVDTGASSVTINRSTARRIGIELDDRDFKNFADTANGRTSFARATIDEIRINGIVVRNVRTAVLKDTSLNKALLGMTFLNKLKKFEFQGNQLKLIQ
jgi:aspartyl protease family protein